MDLLPDPVIAYDASRRITVWNRAAERTYGFSRAEAVGHRASQLLRMRVPQPIVEVLEEVADTGGWRGDIVARAKDGREVDVEAVLVALCDERGLPAGAIGVHRDITERLQTQRERAAAEGHAERERLHGHLHRAQRLESIGSLAGGIAHDFNNLLAIIINYSALISADLDGLAAQARPESVGALRADLAEIERAAERGATLTHQLLSFSRQEPEHPTAVDLNECVRGIEGLLRRTLGEHIELHISLAQELRPIRADRAALDQLLLNLAVNSRDAMPGGGVLAIDTANVEVDEESGELRPGPHVRLRVSDSGSGMAPEVLERAFDPFFTTRPPGQATGLGLAAVYGIVRQACGSVQLHSEPGLGTTFSALFPARPEPEPPERTRPGGGAVRTILLVEDEEALREATRRTLARAGYSVTATGDPLHALALAEDFDLLLADVVMPGMLGPQLALQMRMRRPSLRILFMTGFAGGVLHGALAIEGAELIEKPFSGPQLLARVAAIAGAL